MPFFPENAKSLSPPGSLPRLPQLTHNPLSLGVRLLLLIPGLPGYGGVSRAPLYLPRKRTGQDRGKASEGLHPELGILEAHFYHSVG